MRICHGEMNQSATTVCQCHAVLEGRKSCDHATMTEFFVFECQYPVVDLPGTGGAMPQGALPDNGCVNHEQLQR